MRIDKLTNTKRFFLTDGGLETYMIFDKGYELPCFSAAVLLDCAPGRRDLTDYYERFIQIALESHRGYILDAPTWRAGSAWAGPLGQSVIEVMETNTRAVEFVSQIRNQYETDDFPILVNGLIGPAGDAYAHSSDLSVEDALLIHAPQVHALGRSGVDLVSAMTLTNTNEATGIVHAAKEIDLPVVIAFTLETDGKLPTGQTLCDAIEEVDAATEGGPIYYMINCAHPEHFRNVLSGSSDWLQRIGGIRSNASRLSHAELDHATELDSGDPVELARLNADLLTLLPNIKVIGGCCGTDHRHVVHIADLQSEQREAV